MFADSIEQHMTKSVVTVTRETSVQEVLARLQNDRVSCVLVVTANKPVGIITERDVVSLAVAAATADDTPQLAEDLMHSPVTTVRVDSSIEAAGRMMEELKIRHLPVVHRSGELAGIVTQTDVIDAQSLLKRR